MTPDKIAKARAIIEAALKQEGTVGECGERILYILNTGWPEALDEIERLRGLLEDEHVECWSCGKPTCVSFPMCTQCGKART